MYYFVKSNSYVKDGVAKCFVTLFDDRSNDVISCGPAASISGADLSLMVDGLKFACPVNVDLTFVTFNNNVRPQIVSIKKEGK